MLMMIKEKKYRKVETWKQGKIKRKNNRLNDIRRKEKFRTINRLLQF